MKFLIFFTLILYSIPVLSQEDSIRKQRSRTYISINNFQKKIGPLTKQDSVNMLIRGEDTLVLIRPGHNYNPSTRGKKVAYEPRDTTFLRKYKDVVYNPDGNSADKQTLKIWKDGIKVFFTPSVPRKHQKILMDFAKKISSGIDSLAIKEVKEINNANYLVYYLDDEDSFDYAPGISMDSAGTYIYWNGKQHLYQGFLKVNTEIVTKEKEQIEALKYYFFRSLGNFLPSNQLTCGSYLSSCSIDRELSEMDLEILKYHYSYGICKGINLETFEDIHQDYLSILKKHPEAKLYVVHPE